MEIHHLFQRSNNLKFIVINVYFMLLQSQKGSSLNQPTEQEEPFLQHTSGMYGLSSVLGELQYGRLANDLMQPE